jgi:hypothetical protein
MNPPTDRTHPRLLRPVRALRWPAGGLALGIGWGIAARGWMRYVSEDPEFSWSGTLFIIALAGLAGLALGTVEGLRRRGARLWRLVLVLPALLMFLSPGMIMLPSAVFGSLALTGRGGRWVRIATTLLAIAPISVFFVEDLTGPRHPFALMLAGYVALCVALAAGWTAALRRRVVVPQPAREEVSDHVPA